MAEPWQQPYSYLLIFHIDLHGHEREVVSDRLEGQGLGGWWACRICFADDEPLIGIEAIGPVDVGVGSMPGHWAVFRDDEDVVVATAVDWVGLADRHL